MGGIEAAAGGDAGVGDPAVSVVTAVYNCRELTRRYLETLEATLAESRVTWEAVLVDDGSTDGARELVTEWAGRPAATSGGGRRRVTVLWNEQNRGFAASNNRGAEAARGRVLVFCNNDLELTPGWLEPMLEGLERCPSAGLVGNVQVYPGTGTIDHAGVFFDLEGRPGHARKLRRVETLDREAPFLEWNAVTAACVAVRREVFLGAGGFDPAYRNGFEDIDLAVRLRVEGWRHYVATRSRVGHHVSQSPGRKEANRENSALFQQRWAAVTREWGRREWPEEYLRRYAEQWWKFNLGKLARAWWLRGRG